MSLYSDLITKIENMMNLPQRHQTVKGRLKDIAEATGTPESEMTSGVLLSDSLNGIIGKIQEAAETEPAEPEEPVNITNLLKTELQNLCADLGISKKGTKAELIERIIVAGHGKYIA